MKQTLPRTLKLFLLRSAVIAAVIILATQPSRASSFPGTTDVVIGVATTSDGHPLPRATLYLLGLPPGQSWSATLGDNTTVVTDDQGRFTWNVPETVNIFPNNGSSPPRCWALAVDRAAWQYAVHLTHPLDPNTLREPLEHSVAPCVTRWIHAETGPVLSVTAPDMGGVTMAIRGPDGIPLRNHAIQVFFAEPVSSMSGAVVYQGKTDGAGGLNLRCYPGVFRVQMLVDGVGFGSTGTFEVPPDGNASPTVPPLAPFASLSGSVVPAPSGLPETVKLAHRSSEYSWLQRSAAVDARGRWTLTEVPPGTEDVELSDGHVTTDTDITVGAGENAANVRLYPLPAITDSGDSGVTPAGHPVSSVALRGTVTDTSGRPVAGASIYAICVDNGVYRRVQQLLTATSDSTGAYVIPNLTGGYWGVSVLLAVIHSGFGPAEASASTGSRTAGGDVRRDFVLPSLSTGLTVRVLQHGAPVPGAAVLLTLGGDRSSQGRYYPQLRLYPDASAARDAVKQLYSPMAMTDPEGKAVFRGLSPGVWGVKAIAGQTLEALDLSLHGLVKYPVPNVFSSAQQVAVRAGQTSEFTLSIYPESHEVSYRLIGPDRTSPPASEVRINYEPAITSVPSGGGVSATLDSAGLGILRFPDSGLQCLDAFFGDPVRLQSSPFQEPFYTGHVLFAVSPSVPEPGPVLIRAARRGPGSIRVRLEDSSGNPARGAAVLSGNFQRAKYGASVDDHGEAVFNGLPSGLFVLRPTLSQPQTLPSLGEANDPFPTDAALTGVTLAAAENVAVHSDLETAVTIRALPQGYVRGWLRVPGRLADYQIYGTYGPLFYARARLNPKTGEFVAGPYPGQSAFLELTQTHPANGSNPPRWYVSVPTVPGKVTYVNLAPEGTPVSRKGHGRRMTMKKATDYYDSRSLTGTVFLPDRVTPAWGARAVAMVPQIAAAVDAMRANAAGRLVESDFWLSADNHIARSSGGPKGPVVVAWLPGSNGAAIVPFTPGKDVHIVLPHSISVSGRVTLGGQPVSAVDSSFRVLAAYQGRGELNPLLSVEATTQADGTFTLGGLTPGTYHVQAARDGIWVSASRTLRVGRSSLPVLALPNLALDIPEPGQTMDLILVDASGRPLPGAVVTLLLPDGPLTDEIWPKTLTADSAGTLHLEGLPAGPQRITVFAPPDPRAAPTDPGKPSPAPLATLTLAVPPWTIGEAAVRKTVTCELRPLR